MGKDDRKKDKKLGFLEKLVNVDGVYDAPTLVLAHLRRQIVWLFFFGLVGLMFGFIFSNFVETYIVNLDATIGAVTITLFAIAGTSISMFVTIANQTTLHVPAFLLAKESHLDELVPRFILGIISSVLLILFGRVHPSIFLALFFTALVSIGGFCLDTWRLLKAIVFKNIFETAQKRMWLLIESNIDLYSEYSSFIRKYWSEVPNKQDFRCDIHSDTRYVKIEDDGIYGRYAIKMMVEKTFSLKDISIEEKNRLTRIQADIFKDIFNLIDKLMGKISIDSKDEKWQIGYVYDLLDLLLSSTVTRDDYNLTEKSIIASYKTLRLNNDKFGLVYRETNFSLEYFTVKTPKDALSKIVDEIITFTRNLDSGQTRAYLHSIFAVLFVELLRVDGKDRLGYHIGLPSNSKEDFYSFIDDIIDKSKNFTDKQQKSLEIIYGYLGFVIEYVDIRHDQTEGEGKTILEHLKQKVNSSIDATIKSGPILRQKGSAEKNEDGSMSIKIEKTYPIENYLKGIIDFFNQNNLPHIDLIYLFRIEPLKLKVRMLNKFFKKTLAYWSSHNGRIDEDIQIISNLIESNKNIFRNVVLETSILDELMTSMDEQSHEKVKNLFIQINAMTSTENPS